jgi:PAS domain S-box-containing protein
MNYEAFTSELQAVRARVGRFHRRARADEVEGDPLPEALEELGIALEELRVTDEELRQQNEELSEMREALELERARYQELFELAPAAYVVTDAAGVVHQANRAAATMLGVARKFLLGKPLIMFVEADERWTLRRLLQQLQAPGGTRDWQLRFRSRNQEAFAATVTVGQVIDEQGKVTGLRWLMREVAPGRAARGPGSPPNEAEALRAGELGLHHAGGRALPDLQVVTAMAMAERGDGSADLLEEGLGNVVRAAAALFHADGAGLMLVDDDDELRWAGASDSRIRAFEQAQAELGEGPCVEAYVREQVVWSSDLLTDPRWPRMGRVAAQLGVKAALCAPVALRGGPIGTCNVLCSTRRGWTNADLGAIRAYATVLVSLLQTAAEVQAKGRVAEQLQHALAHRVVVEQAKGVLMERRKLSAVQAFELLRSIARSSQRKLADVAADIVEGRMP